MEEETRLYLESRACDQGVLAAIQKRLPGWLKDEAFLGSLVFHGGLIVIIDGLNEAGLRTRDEVMIFLRQSKDGSVGLGTQRMGLSWPKSMRVLELQPLDRSRAEEFLVVQGVPKERASAFMESALAARNKRDLADIRMILSNPFDLSVVADLIKRNVTPTLLTLAEQQYLMMAEVFGEREHYDFPLNAFSDYVYRLVVADQSVMTPANFPRELVVMAEEKMVVDRDGNYTFRHDKVRDYFLVIALGRGDRASKHYGDPRFASAYLSLALKLPREQAEALRDDVEEWALDHDDRSLADELRRAMRRRREDQQDNMLTLQN